MKDLKPCPFCGGEAEMIHAVGEWWAICKFCEATTEAHTDKGFAIAAWNIRAERTCHDASVDSSTQFYCSECECTVDVPLLWGEINYCPDCGAKVVGE